MAYKITVKDQWFLNMHRRDPLQGREFELGDRVVVCLDCRCVQTYDSWELCENKCVNCGKSECTSQFSREFIDFNYKRNTIGAKTARGFKVIKKDIEKTARSAYNWFSRQRISRRSLIVSALMMIIVAAMVCLIGHTLSKLHIDFWPRVPLSLFTFYKERAVNKLIYAFKKITKLKVLSRLDIGHKLHPFKWYVNLLLRKGDRILKRASLLFVNAGGLIKKLPTLSSTIIKRIRRLITKIF